jgi:ligand-binding sensor domain-containing protein
MTNMAVSPDGNSLFIGSHGKGVIEIQNDVPVNRFTYVNSTLKYVFTGDTITYATGVAMDSDGNLWVTNYDSDSSLNVFTRERVWKAFWTPTKKAGAIIIDDNGYKWFATPRTSVVGQNIGLCIYDDNRTPLDASDDRFRTLNTQPGTGLLPTNEIKCLLKTRNGEIWIGTDAGLVKFLNPGRVFTSDFYESERTIIEQAGYGGYLLGDEVIYSMALDGAGRIWVGTNKGVWLIARNGRDILLNYNIENSPLPSNNVLSVGVEGKSGEVFFGTDKGLISIRGDATDPEEKLGKLKIFPNPVRETFNGQVSIEGLTEDARVKITDINGHLIFETVSQGGRAVWNCRTLSGYRPATGVYLVFAIDKNGDESSMGKILFIQ